MSTDLILVQVIPVHITQPLQPKQMTAVCASTLIGGLRQSQVTSPPVSINARVAGSNQPPSPARQDTNRTAPGRTNWPSVHKVGSDTSIWTHYVINSPGSDEAGSDKGLTNETRKPLCADNFMAKAIKSDGWWANPGRHRRLNPHAR